MLQRQQPLNALQIDDGGGPPLTPDRLLAILKRRALSVAIPFILVLSIGSVVTIAWPAKYVAEGKILVQSPEIPSNLVQPTVVSLANERIQVIKQRTLTRDNLLAVAKKYNLTTGWIGSVSNTDLVDFIRDRTTIEPLEIKTSNRQQQAIAFTVGFEYENPQIAARVANELLTMILSEDARSRSGSASETTKFLEQDVRRIEDQLKGLDGQIIELKKRRAENGDASMDQPDNAKQLANLKAQLAVKSATLSAAHPDIIALKRAIRGLEKAAIATGADPKSGPKASDAASTTGAANSPGLDTLETKREDLKDQLSKASQKLATARLGESLERGRHSEKLEVLEQPTVPDKPTKPNRLKLFAAVVAAAFMAGGGLAFAREMMDDAIRSKEDIAAIIDSSLIVPIPYISTQRELRQKRVNIILAVLIVFAVLVAVAAAAYFFLPPPDVWFDKATDKLMRLLLK